MSSPQPRSHQLLVACTLLCIWGACRAEQPSAAPDQKTLPQKPLLGLTINNPEGEDVRQAHHSTPGMPPTS